MPSNRFVLVVSAFVFGLLLCAGTATAANAVQPVKPSVSIMSASGKYSDPQAGVQITFPYGWNGGMVHSATVTGILLTKNTKALFPLIYFAIADKSHVDNMANKLKNLTSTNTQFRQALEALSKGCEKTAPTIITVNGIKGEQTIMQCPNAQSFKSKVIIFQTHKNYVVLSLFAQPPEFDKYNPDFDSTLSTLKISK